LVEVIAMASASMGAHQPEFPDSRQRKRRLQAPQSLFAMEA
jgi:hypothetical protein